MSLTSLSSVFLAHVADASPWLSEPELEQKLRALVLAARELWPGISLSPTRFVRHLAQRVERDGPLSLDSIHATDLFLACACLYRAKGAWEVFESSLGDLTMNLSRVDATAAFAEEVRFALWEYLVVPAEGQPARINGYRGKGPLKAWLGVVGVRLASRLKESEERQRGAPLLAVPASTSRDPELAVIKGQHRREFAAALEETVALLKPEQRSALRMHYGEGLTVDGVATLFKVNKSTISRWLSDARREILEKCRTKLRERLGTSDSELDRLIQSLVNSFDVTLSQCLGSST